LFRNEVIEACQEVGIDCHADATEEPHALYTGNSQGNTFVLRVALGIRYGEHGSIPTATATTYK
jgi:hypothetical protein